ncbi:MAG: FtsX-like permease family protein [Clostridiales bacterium]|nr:FtsX-like permease family protein [Clostridiales bacterium]
MSSFVKSKNVKKKALHKDFRMEIKKTYMRFLSILLIVALGVSFYSGLRACKADMLESSDAYYDEVNFMDVYVAGTMGISEEDIHAIEAIEGVANVEGAYTKDVLVQMEDQNIVVKTFSENETVNQFYLIDGRRPTAENECMVDTAFLKNTGHQIGDTITLFLENQDLKESLHEVELTIVGSCNYAKYLSLFRGNGEIGNGSINSFVVLKKSNYIQDVYSEAYVLVKGGKSLDCYGEEYQELIKKISDKIEVIAEIQCQKRYDDVMEEPKQKFLEAKTEYAARVKELEEKKKTANESLDQAMEQLNQFNDSIMQAEEAIKEKKEKLFAIHYSESDIEQVLAPLLSSLEEQKAQYGKAKEEFDKQESELNEQFLIADAKLARALTQLSEQEEELNSVSLPKWYIGDRNWVESYVSYIHDADRIDAIAKIFPAIFFFVAALVCLTTMTRMVDEQRTQIGILKALGYGKLAIAGKFMKYCLFATVSGSVIGALLGQKIFPFTVINAYRIMYVGLPYVLTNYKPYDAIVAGVLAIGCTMIATYAACMKDLMAEPAELMRPVAPKAGKRILLERIPLLWNHINFTKKSTLRNLFRYKKRFFMTTIGIAGCMGLIIVGFGLKDSIGVMADLQFEDLWLQDGEIALVDDLTEQGKNDFINQLVTEKEITKAQLLYKKKMEGSHNETRKSVTLYVLNDDVAFDDFFLFRDRESKQDYKIGDHGVIVTEKYASMLHLNVGDKLHLDLGDDQSVDVTVDAIAENYLEHYVFMKKPLYQSLTGNPVPYNACLLRLVPEEEAAEKQLFSRILSNYSEVMSISSTRALNERIHSMLESLNIITYVLIVSAGLLAFVVLYNLSNININERKRELASLKVLGFYDGEVNSYVMRENIILTVFGIVLGIGFGKALHGFVIQTCEIDAVMFGRLIKGISYIFSAALTLVFSFMICFFTYFKLKKVDMIESLKSVE